MLNVPPKVIIKLSPPNLLDIIYRIQLNIDFLGILLLLYFRKQVMIFVDLLDKKRRYYWA